MNSLQTSILSTVWKLDLNPTSKKAYKLLLAIALKVCRQKKIVSIYNHNLFLTYNSELMGFVLLLKGQKIVACRKGMRCFLASA